MCCVALVARRVIGQFVTCTTYCLFDVGAPSMVFPWIVFPSVRNCQLLQPGGAEKLVPDTDKCFAGSRELSVHCIDYRNV